MKLASNNKKEFEQDVKNKVKKAAQEFEDKNFAKLIEKVKPKCNYYEHKFGEKILFFDRVDGLKYDIVEEEKLRKAR